MIKLYLKKINYLLELNDSITIINIDNVKYYRSLILDYENELILSIDNKEYQIDKNILFIMNPLNIDINNKKLISALLKELSLTISEENKIKLSLIEKQIIDILDDISYDSSFKIAYDTKTNLINIFNIYNVCFADISFNNYVELLINYIKISFEYLKYKMVITNGLLNILTEDEYILLKKELQINGIKIVDIQCNKSYYHINYLKIDEDFCVI